MEGGEKLGGVEGGQTVIRIYRLREQSTFNEMEKRKNKNKKKDVKYEITSVCKMF